MAPGQSSSDKTWSRARSGRSSKFRYPPPPPELEVCCAMRSECTDTAAGEVTRCRLERRRSESVKSDDDGGNDGDADDSDDSDDDENDDDENDDVDEDGCRVPETRWRLSTLLPPLVLLPARSAAGLFRCVGSCWCCSSSWSSSRAVAMVAAAAASQVVVPECGFSSHRHW